ncbi:unnamed protein product [Arctogadus glacialis]
MPNIISAIEGVHDSDSVHREHQSGHQSTPLSPSLEPLCLSHMLDMSWEEHELKMELIRAQARRAEELHGEREKAL